MKTAMPSHQKNEATQPALGSFSQLIDQFFQAGLNQNSVSAFNPAVDILEHEDSYEIQLSAPGAKKEDFGIEIEKNVLTVSGSRRFEQKTEGKTWHRVETQYGSFARTFTLPEHSLADKIEARYEDGVLHVVIPKDQQKLKSAKISVK